MRILPILFFAVLPLGCGSSSSPQPTTPTATASSQAEPTTAQQATPAQRELCVSLCTRAFDCGLEAVAEMKKTLEGMKPGAGDDPSVTKAKATAEEFRGKCLQDCDRPPAEEELTQIKKLESCRSAPSCKQFAECVDKQGPPNP